jgi:hypothetical protein
LLHRRLARAYEILPDRSEAMIHLAMTDLMDRRLNGESTSPGARSSPGQRGWCCRGASVWRLLTGRLGWSLQRPERRAVERDESAIARWIAHEWPRIKKGP